MFLILFQLALLLLTVWGWGYWLWKGLGFDRRPWRWSPWFCGLGGYALCMLVLQNLVYLDLRLAWTGWLGLLVAIAGVTCSVRRLRSSFRRSRCREAKWIAAVFLAVFCAQGCALFHTGPRNYYGFAHNDQVNYVLLAQFFVDKPFSTSLSDIGLHPWLVVPVIFKSQRVGQSIANGYLASITFADAKTVYGTYSIFLIAIAAVATYLLMRALAAPRLLGAMAASWWGLLPAVSKLHLDGFLSQASILWVFPSIAALFCLRRWRAPDRPTIILAAVYLSYLFCDYSEVYILGVALIGGFLLLARDQRIAVRAAHGMAIFLGSLVLAVGYLPHFLKFVVLQYGAASSPLALAGIVPMSGTFTGWMQIFFGYQVHHNERVERLLMIIALGLIFVIGFAFQGRGRGKNRLLLALMLTPIGILILLLSAPVLPKYPFSKLLDTFTPFWILLITLGIRHLGHTVLKSSRKADIMTYAVLALLVGTTFYGSMGLWGDVFKNSSILWTVNSPKARQCYAAAKREGAGSFVICEENDVFCAWLAYHARKANVYLDANSISDRPTPAASYEFRHVPTRLDQITILGDDGPITSSNAPETPLMTVWNPQGEDQDGTTIWWWLGKEIQFEVLNLSKSTAMDSYVIQFDAGAGPENPDPMRKLELIGADNKPQRFDFTGSGRVRFPIRLQPGRNIYTLRVVYPAEQTVVIANDPRDHMVRIEHLSIARNDPPNATGLLH